MKINFKVILALIIAIALIVGLSMLETDEMKIKSEEQAILLDKGETLEQENSVLDYLYIAQVRKYYNGIVRQYNTGV